VLLDGAWLHLHAFSNLLDIGLGEFHEDVSCNPSF
jgi:hypothetical protein